MKLYFLFLFFLSSSSNAFFAPFAFVSNQSQTFMFSTSSQSLYTYTCSSIMTVKSTYGGVTTKTLGANQTVNLTGTATFYSDSSCSQVITSVTIASGTSTASFYFIDTSAGTKTVTAAAAGWVSGTQNETLTLSPHMWTGGGGNAFWSTALNWSGGAAPGAGHTAIFDVCSSNCNPSITATVTIAGIRMTNNYTGTINQNAQTINLASGHYVQFGGTFSGDASGVRSFNITSSNMVIAGGTFTAPAANTNVTGAWAVRNSPTVTFPATSNLGLNCNTTPANCWNVTVYIEPGSVTYNDLTITGYKTQYDFSGQTATVARNLVIGDQNWGGNAVSNGTLQIGGNVTLSAYGNGGTAVIELTGKASGQTVTGGASGWLPTLKISAGANPVTLSSVIQVSKYEYVSSGTFTTTGSTLRIYCMSSFCSGGTIMYLTFGGGVTYNDVTIIGDQTNYNLNGTTLNVAGNLSVGDASWNSYGLSNGTIKVGGNVTSNSYGYHGSALIELTGNASGQTVTGAGSLGSRGMLPSLKINAGANPVTLSGAIQLYAGYEYVASGTFTTTGSTLAITCLSSWSECYNTTQSLTFGGSETYNDVVITGIRTNYNLNSTTLNVGGNLTIGDGNWTVYNINSGSIVAQGNITKSNHGYLGTATVTLSGSGNQSINMNNGSFPRGTFTVNKSGGTATLASSLSLSGTGQNMVITAGTVNMAGYNLAVNSNLSLASGTVLTKSGGTLTHGSLSNSGTINP